MKLLPCSKCGPLGAMLPKTAAFPEGEPYLSAGNVPRYQCHRCKSLNALSKAQWAALPELTIEDFARLSVDRKGRKNPILADMPVKDFMGAGHTRKEAEDLFRGGFRAVSELEKESR